MSTKPIQSLRARCVRPGGRGRGQVMVLICVSIVAMMGMIGVVADFSFMQHQRNMMQTAADSAAMAGSEELSYGDEVTAGKADAASNGYTDGAASVTVTMNNPPSSGPNAGNSGYVEAIVSKPESTYFLRVLGVTTMTVSARAVAYEGNGPNCIYVLNPSASGAMSANGNVTVSSGCGLLVDSSSSTGLSVVGNVSITAPSIGVVGGYSAGGILRQRQCRREQRLRPAGGLELLDRFVGSRQRLDHSAEYRRGGGIQFGRQFHPFADAQDWGDSGVRSAGQRAGADGRFMRSYQFFTEREQRQQRQSLPALSWNLLRRYLGPRQCHA